MKSCRVVFHGDANLLAKSFHCNVNQMRDNWNSIDGGFVLAQNVTSYSLRPWIYITRKNNARITLFNTKFDGCLFFKNLASFNSPIFKKISNEFNRTSNFKCPFLTTVVSLCFECFYSNFFAINRYLF